MRAVVIDVTFHIPAIPEAAKLRMDKGRRDIARNQSVETPVPYERSTRETMDQRTLETSTIIRFVCHGLEGDPTALPAMMVCL
ncbi:hypothetical protein C0V73_02790 [Rhizobium sp. TH135]|nr:hypothetical protein C0V73_02790 [Rhizobium sp. TH135]